MQPDLTSLLHGLERAESGIWFTRTRAAISYPAHGNIACLAVEDRSFWFRHRNRCIVSVVRHFRPDGEFLDIGGGNGYVAKGLQEAGIACALVEPGIDGAMAAHARGIDPVICASLEDLGLPSASIAAAGMFDVLEHIEDEATVLRELYRLLRPDGRLFLTVPAYQFLYSADDTVAGHFRRYTVPSLSRVLVRAAFRVEFASYIFAPLPPLVFLLRTIPSRLGLRTASDSEALSSDHSPEGVTARMMEHLLAMEYGRIDAGHTLPFGGSCLCVAIKD